MFFNTTGKGYDRRAGNKGHKRKVNAKDVKPDRKVDYWNHGGKHFARDYTKPAKDSDKK